MDVDQGDYHNDNLPSNLVWLKDSHGKAMLKKVAFDILPLKAIAQKLKTNATLFQEAIRNSPELREVIMEGEMERFNYEINRMTATRELFNQTQRGTLKDKSMRVTAQMRKWEAHHFELFLRLFQTFSLTFKEEMRKTVNEEKSHNEVIKEIQLKSLKILNKKLGTERKSLSWNKESYKLLNPSLEENISGNEAETD